MAKGDHEFKRRPSGSVNGGYRRPRVQIGFEEKQLRAVTKRAKLNNRSFAAEVRALVAAGLKFYVDVREA